MIDVASLIFDDENEAKLTLHGVTIDEVMEARARWPRYYVNHPDRRATHVMVGVTSAGRILVIPIEPVGREEDGTWRPVTGFESAPGQAARYRSNK